MDKKESEAVASLGKKANPVQLSKQDYSNIIKLIQSSTIQGKDATTVSQLLNKLTLMANNVALLPDNK